MLTALLERQRCEGLTDVEFARSIHVSHSTWRQTKHNMMPVGWALVIGATARYPDLFSEAVKFLAGEVQKVPEVQR